MKTLLVSLLVLLSSCAWLKSEGKTAGTAAIDCAKQDFGPLMTDTASALTSDDPNAAIAKLESDGKSDAVACAVKAVVATLFSVVPPAVVGSAEGTPTPASKALSAGQKLMAQRGWKYAQ